MSETAVARKLAHLHIKRSMGKISPTGLKILISQAGREQKYPREVGMLAQRAARSVADIVGDCETIDHATVSTYGDAMIVSGTRLIVIEIDFEEKPDDPVESLLGDTQLRATVALAYHSVKDAYPIDTIEMTKLYALNSMSASIGTSIHNFKLGE